MALPLEVRQMRVRVCPDCRSVLQPVPGAPGAYMCPHGHGEWLRNEPEQNAGPPPMSGGEARRPFGGTWALKLVPKELVLSEAQRRQAFQEELNGTTLDTLYQHPLPPVVQSPNKGGKGGKPGRGSRSKSRKRKKKDKKKRERPLADYQ